jgi:ATP-dependent DNA ligase
MFCVSAATSAPALAGGAARGAQAACRPRQRNLVREAQAAEGEVVFAKACELGLEGIVSKREGSFYKSGKSRNWLKTTNPDFVST